MSKTLTPKMMQEAWDKCAEVESEEGEEFELCGMRIISRRNCPPGHIYFVKDENFVLDDHDLKHKEFVTTIKPDITVLSAVPVIVLVN